MNQSDPPPGLGIEGSARGKQGQAPQRNRVTFPGNTTPSAWPDISMQDLRNGLQPAQDSRNAPQSVPGPRATYVPGRHGFFREDRPPFSPQDVRNASLAEINLKIPPIMNNGRIATTSIDN